MDLMPSLTIQAKGHWYSWMAPRVSAMAPSISSGKLIEARSLLASGSGFCRTTFSCSLRHFLSKAKSHFMVSC